MATIVQRQECWEELSSWRVRLADRNAANRRLRQAVGRWTAITRAGQRAAAAEALALCRQQAAESTEVAIAHFKRYQQVG